MIRKSLTLVLSLSIWTRVLSCAAPYWAAPHPAELCRTLLSFAATCWAPPQYWASPRPTELRRTLLSCVAPCWKAPQTAELRRSLLSCVGFFFIVQQFTASFLVVKNVHLYSSDHHCSPHHESAKLWYWDEKKSWALKLFFHLLERELRRKNWKSRLFGIKLRQRKHIYVSFYFIFLWWLRVSKITCVHHLHLHCSPSPRPREENYTLGKKIQGKKQRLGKIHRARILKRNKGAPFAGTLS